MSNPSGTGSDEDRGTEAPAQPPVADDPVTEVIEVVEMPGEAFPPEYPPEYGDDRRYTAPGFDAGSTQIIDRVGDQDTEFISAPTEAFPSSPRLRAAHPQAIRPGAPRRRSWLVPVLLVAAALVAAATVGLVLVKRSQAAEAARISAVRSTIETFDAAVRSGDLATLRNVTCGQTRQTYVNYDDTAWADTYERVSAAKQYPVVASVDDVVVDGNHAEANVTSYMAFDPSTTSTRSFDLQYGDDQWKICQTS